MCLGSMNVGKSLVVGHHAYRGIALVLSKHACTDTQSCGQSNSKNHASIYSVGVIHPDKIPKSDFLLRIKNFEYFMKVCKP